MTNNLDPDGTDDVPYSGIPFGSDPEVDVNALPIGDDPIWGVSGMGNVVGDFLMVTISPASGGNAGGVGVPRREHHGDRPHLPGGANTNTERKPERVSQPDRLRSKPRAGLHR